MLVAPVSQPAIELQKWTTGAVLEYLQIQMHLSAAFLFPHACEPQTLLGPQRQTASDTTKESTQEQGAKGPQSHRSQ